MSEQPTRRERTITVETSELGPVRVRRLSLGGMARIAERLRAEGQHDEIALGDALVTEVLVAGMEGDPVPGEQPPDAFDHARLALLSQEDRRSIAAAVLTLEGIKATGDGVLEDPRSVLARRYSHVLETGRAVDRESLPVDEAFADSQPAQPAAPSPQISLFNDILPPPAASISAHQSPEAALLRPTSSAPQTARESSWKKERTRLLQEIADLQASLEQQSTAAADDFQATQARDPSALDARSSRRATNPDLQGEAADTGRWTGRGNGSWTANLTAQLTETWFAMQASWRNANRAFVIAAASVLALLFGIQFAWIASLYGDLSEQKSHFETRFEQQQQALDKAAQTAREADARARTLEEQLRAEQQKLAQMKAAQQRSAQKRPPQRQGSTTKSKSGTSKSTTSSKTPSKSATGSKTGSR
jgi:hypothetical protein